MQSDLNEIYTYNNIKVLLSELLNFNYKKRLDLHQINEKISTIENFENNEYNLEYMIE